MYILNNEKWRGYNDGGHQQYDEPEQTVQAQKFAHLAVVERLEIVQQEQVPEEADIHDAIRSGERGGRQAQNGDQEFAFFVEKSSQ